MAKLNCWDMKHCGRVPDGENVDDLGLCPAAMNEGCNGLNGGVNGGRICWAIAGTFCGGKVQGSFAQKSVTCMSCSVYTTICEEERAAFVLLVPGKKYVAEG